MCLIIKNKKNRFICCCAHSHDINCSWLSNYAYGNEEETDYLFAHKRHLHYCSPVFNCPKVFIKIIIFLIIIITALK